MGKEWQASFQVRPQRSAIIGLKKTSEISFDGKLTEYRCHHNMLYTLPRFIAMIRANSADRLLQPDFFEVRDAEALGVKIRTVKPIIKFDQGEVELKYNVSTRGNGVDAPKWPEDLMTEIIR
jgi:hypothetical protein